MPREKAQAAPIARPKVPMRRLGADCSVVATKRGNARGAKGAGHRHELGSTGSYREEPECFSGRRQPSCDGTSRMTRECHVRICERLGVRFPGPTRQNRKSPTALLQVRSTSAGSTGRRNTGVKSLCWGFKLQGLTWSFVQLTSHFVQMGLRVHRQVGALRKVLS